MERMSIVFAFLTVVYSDSINEKFSFETRISSEQTFWTKNNCTIYGKFFNTSHVEESVTREVYLQLHYNCSKFNFAFDSWNVSFNVVSENTKNLYVNESSWFNGNSDDETFGISFDVKGIFLGYSLVTVNATFYFTEGINVVLQKALFKQKFGVVRKELVWMIFFTVFMGLVVAMNYINMGVQLDLGVVKKVLKRPIGPAIGFISQFTIMPLAAFGFGLLFLRDEEKMRLGLFTLGCSPGGSSSNFWTLMFGGDIDLSITMTFISSLAALGMMPLWVYTLGKRLFTDGKVQLPYANLVTSLVTLTAPLLVGIFIKYKLPRVAAFSRKIIKPMTIFCVIIAIVMASALNYYIFMLFTWQIIASSFAICFSGYIVGGFLAWLGRLEWKQIVTVSIETAFQNSTVTFVILSVSLEQPERDLVVVPVVAQIMFTGLPLWFIYCGIKARDKIYGKKAGEYDLEMTEPSHTAAGKENTKIEKCTLSNENKY